MQVTGRGGQKPPTVLEDLVRAKGSDTAPPVLGKVQANSWAPEQKPSCLPIDKDPCVTPRHGQRVKSSLVLFIPGDGDLATSAL